MLSLEQLEVFRAVVKAGGFNRAASELFVTQPAVSRTIRQMEEALGVKLFYRCGNRRKVSLTPAGEQVLHFADQVIALWGRLQHEIRSDTSEDRQSTVSIACGPTSSRYILPELLRRYNSIYPSVRFSLRVWTTAPDIDADVLSGHADLGVQTDWFVSGEFHLVPLFRDRLVLIGPPGEGTDEFPSSPAEVGTLPFITTPRGTPYRTFLERWSESLAVRLEPRMEVSSVDILKQLVRLGVGYAITSEISVVQDLAEGAVRLLRAPGLPLEYNFYAAYVPQRPLSSAASALLALLKGAAFPASYDVGPKAVAG